MKTTDIDLTAKQAAKSNDKVKTLAELEVETRETLKKSLDEYFDL
jgi:hypothetical protein